MTDRWIELPYPKFHHVFPTEEDEIRALREAIRSTGAAPGRYLVVRDDDAATVGAHCWWAARLGGEVAGDLIEAYQFNGGTVSYWWIVPVPKTAEDA